MSDMQTQRKSEEKEKATVVSFDFDDTLAKERFVSKAWGFSGDTDLFPITTFVDLLKEYHALGCECIILTARTPTPQNESIIKKFLKDNKIDHCISKIVYTSHEPKGPFAASLGVSLHYDDCEEHLCSVSDFGIAVVGSL